MIIDLISQGDRERARKLIEAAGLCFEPDVDEMLGVHEGGALLGTASRKNNVLKMFALAPEAQGGGLLGELASELLRRAFEAGQESLFVFTKPEYAPSFEQLNFTLLATAGQAVMLEHGGGLARYLAHYGKLFRPGDNGAVVVNANPFSLGHRYLIEQAAQSCDTLYVFVVQEDRSVFPYTLRRRLVEEGTADLDNVVVLGSSSYAVSAQTFPAYFLNRDEDVPALQMEIDLTLFAEQIAPAFSLRRRFVGHEPYCVTTRQYNETMRRVLPRFGIELVELERRRVDESSYVSASRVRDVLRQHGADDSELSQLVPPTTLAALRSEEARPILSRLQANKDRHG
ncbi:MAG: [citrate (pro-3S)-lyase] ligase [Planctomycetota bacterium]|nr:MAG: [citrate (pro-3S)-lyase] ligase [Planctomycetota bacterium]